MKSNKTLTSCLIFALTVTLGLGVQAEPKVMLEKIDRIDDSNRAAWWSPIAVDPTDDSIFIAYLRPNKFRPKDDDVYVAHRDAVGQWSTYDSGGDAWHDPGHTQASLAIDGDGFIHLFYGMHTGPLRYRRSYVAGNPALGFVQMWPDAMFHGYYTYPNLTTAPNGDIYLGIRDYPDGEFYRYDVKNKKWSFVGHYAREKQTTVYPDHFVADNEGNVHIIWEWAAGGAQAARHKGSYALYNPGDNTFYRADGSAYAGIPIVTETADIFQPLEGGEQFAHGVHGYQSAKMTLDGQNRPIIAYAYSTNQKANGYQFRMARWDGEKWIRQTVVEGPFSLDKPWITMSDGEIRYYGTVSPDDPLHTGSDDIFMRYSKDFGQTWSRPTQITDGLSVQRPVGVTVDGVDYLYLPSMNNQTLYVARVQTQ